MSALVERAPRSEYSPRREEKQHVKPKPQSGRRSRTRRLEGGVDGFNAGVCFFWSNPWLWGGDERNRPIRPIVLSLTHNKPQQERKHDRTRLGPARPRREARERGDDDDRKREGDTPSSRSVDTAQPKSNPWIPGTNYAGSSWARNQSVLSSYEGRNSNGRSNV